MVPEPLDALKLLQQRLAVDYFLCLENKEKRRKSLSNGRVSWWSASSISRGPSRGILRVLCYRESRIWVNVVVDEDSGDWEWGLRGEGTGLRGKREQTSLLWLPF